MGLDQIAKWFQFLALLPVIFAAYKLPTGFRWLKMRMTDSLAGAMLSQVMPALQEVKSQLSEVRHQVFPNNGGSMKDVLDRVLSSAERTEHTVCVLQSTMRAHQDADLAQARFEADTEGLFTWVSHAMLRWCNRASEQILGHGWVNCLSPLDRDRVRAEWEQAIAERREFSMRFVMRTVGGEEFPVEAFAKPIRFGPLGTPDRWVGVITKVYVLAPPP